MFTVKTNRVSKGWMRLHKRKCLRAYWLKKLQSPGCLSRSATSNNTSPSPSQHNMVSSRIQNLPRSWVAKWCRFNIVTERKVPWKKLISGIGRYPVPNTPIVFRGENIQGSDYSTCAYTGCVYSICYLLVPWSCCQWAKLLGYQAAASSMAPLSQVGPLSSSSLGSC